MNGFALLAFALLVGTVALRRARANVTVIASSALLTLAFAARGAADAGLMLVHTPSVPVGFYWRTPHHGLDPEIGQYVCLQATSPAAPRTLREGLRAGRLPPAWRAEPLIKRVAARAGAVVSYDVETGVRVGAQALAKSVARQRDSQGRALPSASYPVQLAASQVWLHSEHALGFDSRYFGPVDIAALTCTAEPLWTW